jgi:hypothetical protein
MRHCGWVLLTLCALPACLDPIVGSECAKGYSDCRGTCVVAGTCSPMDAAVDTALGFDAKVRIDTSQATSDVATVDSSGESWSFDEVNPLDGDQIETAELVDAEMGSDALATDALATNDVWVSDLPLASDDAPMLSDTPIMDDTGTGPTVGVDMAKDEIGSSDDGASIDILPCVDCVDGGEASDGGGGEDAPDIDGALVCSESQSICNHQCVDFTSDPANCSDCNVLCPSGVCNNSVCLVCDADQTVCGRQCVNTTTDPDNCGGCGYPCINGLCSNGHCEATGTGRAIVIGHDYLNNRTGMNRILGNAVFLWPVNPVHLFVYQGKANATAMAGATTAITQVANATGRQVVQTVAANDVLPSDLALQLASADVFLIYGQESADDTALIQLGLDWSTALFNFVNSGGTVVLLDGMYTSNSGTCQILAQAGLLQVTRNVSATGDVCTVVAHGDALAIGLPKTYLCEKNSTSFVVTDAAPTVTTVVQDIQESSVQAVVVDKTF